MRIVYLSSSSIPSRAANSIHVMKMCQALVSNGHEVALIVPDRKGVEANVHDVFSFYGVKRCFEVVRLPWRPVKGMRYVYGYLAAREAKMRRAEIVYGRNMIGCSIAARMGMPVVYESHAPADDMGGISGWIFRKLIRSAGLQRLVVITHALKDYYLDRYPALAKKVQVAPDGADPVSANAEPAELPSQSQKLRVGYVGHLYAGRGIEIIEHLARACPWADFHMVGGAAQDVEACASRIDSLSNVFLHGFKSPPVAERYRLAMDVLLAPYQERVSVYGGNGNGGLDTARWMSPLKVFEYMAAGKAIVCSDLPVLREILTHNVDALLVPPSDIQAWRDSLVSLRDDSDLRSRLGRTAQADLLANYTWGKRAASVLPGVS